MRVSSISQMKTNRGFRPLAGSRAGGDSPDLSNSRRLCNGRSCARRAAPPIGVPPLPARGFLLALRADPPRLGALCFDIFTIAKPLRSNNMNSVSAREGRRVLRGGGGGCAARRSPLMLETLPVVCRFLGFRFGEKAERGVGRIFRSEGIFKRAAMLCHPLCAVRDHFRNL
jgi:hypothetical protein